jgi:hypothetical protein
MRRPTPVIKDSPVIKDYVVIKEFVVIMHCGSRSNGYVEVRRRRRSA